MLSTLKAEFRKVLTLRSTYFIWVIALLMTVFFAFYIEGIKASGEITDSGKMASEVIGAISILSVLGAFIALLLATHEYRYNTIAYTLTSAKSRIRVLLSKIIVVSCFAVAFALFFGALSPLLTYLGLQIKGVSMADQVFPVWSLLWRAVFVAWGYAMLALLLGTAIRSQIGAIVAFLLIPSTLEPLLGLLLKENTAYLPYTALGSVLQQIPGTASLSYGKAAFVFMCYLAAGWAITWFLFLRRDAN